MPERLLLSLNEAAKTLSLGKTKLYQLIKAGEIRSVKIGKAHRVPIDAIKEYVDGLPGMMD